VDPFLSIQSSSATISAEGGQLTLNIRTNTDWKIGNLPPYVQASPLSGQGNTTVTFTVGKHITRSSRQANIMIAMGDSGQGQVFSIQQQAYTGNTPPSPPVLISPANLAADLPSGGISFSWEPSVDVNEDHITYTLYYYREETPHEAVACGANTQASLFAALHGESVYYWYVTACDGYESVKSETRQFSTAVSLYRYEGEVRTLLQNRPQNGVNLVFLCDGFVLDDLIVGGVCDQAVEEALDYFFDVEPYKSYKHYFNAYVVYSFSAERGASYGDVNTLKNTSFSLTCDKDNRNSTYISCDSAKVFHYAKKAPIGPIGQTTIIVISQDNRYAGTCYMWWGGSNQWGGGKSIALVTNSKKNNYPYNFRGTIHHEAGGHGFAKLADEYIHEETAKNRSRDDIRNAYAQFGVFSNVDVTDNLSLIRWKEFIGLPKYEHVGAYEGGYYFSTGVWRPEPGSCMVNNIAYFNAPSRAAIVRRIKTIAGETFNFETFLANDHITAMPEFAPAPPTRLQQHLYLSPPVLIRE